MANARISRTIEERSDSFDAPVEAGQVASDQGITRERIDAFRDKWTHDALPEIPKDKLKGFHLCWLSTTNQYDTIDKRIALGYDPVRVAELGPGYESLGKMSGGRFEGCVSCNEMILFKIPDELYQEAMRMLHYEMPMEHQTNITANIRGAAEQSKGGRTLLEGGLLEMEKAGRINSQNLHFE